MYFCQISKLPMGLVTNRHVVQKGAIFNILLTLNIKHLIN